MKALKFIWKNWLSIIWVVFILTLIYFSSRPEYRITYMDGKYRVEDLFMGRYSAIFSSEFDTYEQAVEKIKERKARDVEREAERAEPWEPVKGPVDDR